MSASVCSIALSCRCEAPFLIDGFHFPVPWVTELTLITQ